jgi:hypothetical protein
MYTKREKIHNDSRSAPFGGAFFIKKIKKISYRGICYTPICFLQSGFKHTTDKKAFHAQEPANLQNFKKYLN